MRLVSVEVDGFRRFASKVRMGLDGRVVAIVGPNEAGKTSFLRALSRLGTTGSFNASDFARRRQDRPSHVVLARCLIEEDDRAAIGSIPGVERLRWYVWWKSSEGQLYHRVEPSDALRRDRGPRE